MSRNEIINVLSEGGKDAPVSKFMNRNYLVVGPETKLQDFLEQIVEKRQSVALVMDEGGLKGLIDRENPKERMLVQEASKRNEQ